jgi:hypothetical protein
VVALDNGRIQFQGNREEFQTSGVMRGLVQSTMAEIQDAQEEAAIDSLNIGVSDTTVGQSTLVSKPEKKPPREFFEEEQRAVGRVAWSVWKTYILASGSGWYRALFGGIFITAALAPLLENGWLSYWSQGDGSQRPMFYLSIYAAVSSQCNML